MDSAKEVLGRIVDIFSEVLEMIKSAINSFVSVFSTEEEA